jgi:hypothetical protein
MESVFSLGAQGRAPTLMSDEVMGLVGRGDLDGLRWVLGLQSSLGGGPDGSAGIAGRGIRDHAPAVDGG